VEGGVYACDLMPRTILMMMMMMMMIMVDSYRSVMLGSAE
jgi:hypothetical protein